jgi:tRNA threonylcarbamoyladenosine biosynthesis protein TsaB
MTNLLAIETSSEACSVALRVAGEARELHLHAPMRHAELLLPAISRLLAEAELAVSALDAIAFGRGPGSFTSLRIGIGVVQGLAWAVQRPVVPCSSLAAVAQDALDRPGSAARYVSVAVDARMQEVFSAEFERGADGLAKSASEERVAAPSLLSFKAPGPFIAAGNGFERFAELQPGRDAAIACYADALPHAAAIARLATAWLVDHDPLPADQAQPVYIRNNVAAKPRP